jgi:ACS family pantothenate transporter-like MFS transporter
MSELNLKPKGGKRLSLFGVIKELFNWYPSEYPPEENK